MEFRAVLLPAVLTAACACAQTAARPIEPNGPAKRPNAQATYAALRADLPGAESVTVKDFKLEREGGVFHFDQGAFYFYAPVEGHVTGAVFAGKGSFELAPKEKSEQKSLALLTKSSTMKQDFSTVVLRFTDDTAQEIRKAANGAESPANGHAKSAAEDLQKTFRKTLRNNRSEEHTSELQSLRHLECRLLLEKKRDLARGALHGPGAGRGAAAAPVCTRS